MAVKILVVAAVSAASLLPYWSRIVSLPESAAALRIGFNPRYVFTNFDNAAGFPMEQYIWVWGFFALAVVVCGCASLFARTRKPDGLGRQQPTGKRGSVRQDDLVDGAGRGGGIFLVRRRARNALVFIFR